MNIQKFKTHLEFAIKNRYSIKIYYTDDIDVDKHIINWKYPPYIIKNFVVDKIISEIENYFRNSLDYLIVMYFEGDKIVHKIPINLPKNKENF